ncbi:hypothetical protein QL285_038046 [Trifolium repens]|nr:hypothetical protein QL285_038046 [Trifolium repens]
MCHVSQFESPNNVHFNLIWLNNDNDEDDDNDAKSIDEHDKDEDDDEEDEIAANIIDDAVTTACNIIDHSVKLTPNAGLTLSQKTILKFSEFFDGAEASNKNDSVSQGADSAIEFFDGEGNVSLQYADILEDPAGVSSYNWCSHKHWKDDKANAGTSGKDDAVPEETNRNKDNPMEGEAETKRNKSSNNEIAPETERLNDDDDEVGKRTQAGERLNNDNNEDDDNDAKSIDEQCKDEDDDGEDKIAANIIDDAVTAACNIIDHSVKLAPNFGLTLTQETILKFPEFFDGAEASNKNDLVSQGADSATEETILKFPEFFYGETQIQRHMKQSFKYPQFFYGGEPNQCLALVLVPYVMHEKKPTECDSDIVIDATPLKSVMSAEIIDLDNVTPKKRKKHNMLYSDSTYPERRRVVKKSKYLESPYDDAVHESTTTELQKILSTYAWSPDHYEHQIMYCSNNKAHSYSLQRDALWTLQKDG